MLNKIKTVLLILLIIPCASYALKPGDYFQQGTTIINETTQNILVTDPASTLLQNFQLEPDYGVEMTYASDKFTDPAGQTFIHTVNIVSGIDASVICSVKSNLFISKDSIIASKPVSSNEDRCTTSVYQKSGKFGMVYGFQIEVIK